MGLLLFVLIYCEWI